MTPIRSLRDWQISGGVPHAVGFLFNVQAFFNTLLEGNPQLCNRLIADFTLAMRHCFPSQQDLPLLEQGAAPPYPEQPYLGMRA
jgi:hypothetical protein